MKNIGIFLGYAPEQPIKNQGIGRLIAFILCGILEDPTTTVVIAAPAWYKNILFMFLKEQQIDLKRIELITTPGIPYLLKIKNLFSKTVLTESLPKQDHQKNSLSLISKSKQALIEASVRLSMKWLSQTSTSLFLFGLLIFSVISTLLSPLIIGGLFFLLIKKTRKEILKPIRKKFSFLENIIKSPLKNLKNYVFAHKIYNELRKIELNKLISLMNKRNDIATWFIPSLFWPEIGKIKTKTVVAAPDVVFVEFPTLFFKGLWKLAYNQVAATLHVGDHFVCYSEHVKQKHLIETFGIQPNKISIIHHGVIELDKFFQNKNPIAWHDEALKILKNYQKNHLQHHQYLNNFDFTSTRFIFYSSQLRPYKNFLSLIKAFEVLLRKEYLNIKLILTADIDFGDSDVLAYIQNNHLEKDVLWLPNVPTPTLAALNHLAICAVNPSLFEGGFPFTFTEAYSVGTPSVMSNINVTASLIKDEHLREMMLFDPYDQDDIIKKIRWAIKNSDLLFKMQAPLYDEFKKRTWEVVAKEYVGLLNQFAT